MTRCRATRLATCALAGLALAGCYRRFDVVDRIDVDASRPRIDAAAPDAGMPGDAGFTEPIGLCSDPAGVDLLFVIDSSASMAEEQATLIAQLPRMVRDLVEPPDQDLDGLPDWLPIPSLHVGVVTTDMGSAGYPVPTCDRGTFGARLGDDGVLRWQGAASIPGCSPMYPPIFAFGSGDDPAAFANDVSCVASVGTVGCGFEQPLEAMLKALSPTGPTPYTAPDYAPPVFFDMTLGHGDGANAGFVRDDTLLAVIVLTDEEDCSVRDPEIFDPASATYTGELDLRCFRHPDAAHPIERYVDGLAALRADRPDLLALAVIAGVPLETVTELPTRADYEAMLAHPAMEERIDPMTMHLVPSCDVPGRGIAFPPRRLVRTAMALGAGRSTVQSICQSDLTDAIAPIVRLFVRRACNAREVI